jgi:hypothetical protein
LFILYQQTIFDGSQDWVIVQHDLSPEAIPTQWLNEARVWEALLERVPMNAESVRRFPSPLRSFS